MSQTPTQGHSAAHPTHNEKPSVWLLDADQQLIEHLRQLLDEQRTQYARLQADRALQQSLDIVQHLITEYEQALRQAEERAAFHQRTMGRG